MRITDRLPGIDGQGLPARETAAAKEAETAFAAEIDRVEERHWRQSLNKLLAEVDEKAARLKKQQTVRALREYKDAVGRFMKEATRRTYQVKEETGWDRRGNHRSLTTITRVNEELEKLTEMVLDQQKDELGILKKLEDIRGMLVDIYA